jgi:hypothetical protein
MKNKIILISLLLIAFLSFGQAPQKMSFQAVIRNSSNVIVVNALVGIRISILQGSATGTAVFVETHVVTTNLNGLATLAIGTGTNVSGSMVAIDWSTGPFFIMSETDPTGGSAYSITGTSELMSTPYALYAANSAPGPQGIQGSQGETGQTGPTGSQGPIGATGIVSIVSFSGAISSIAPNAPAYVFAGPTATITITSSTQRITAVANAPVGLGTGGPASVQIDICYQAITSGTISGISGTNYSIVNVTTNRFSYGCAATITGLPQGTYRVGFGVRNTSPNPINNNDFVNGWVMVTN